MLQTARRSKRQHEVKGFTLIELLVVIAIIAILAAILFPVFAKARENARRASCQSAQKQILLGVMQYTQDYDETYPFSYGFWPNNCGSYWPIEIYPYVKSSQIFMCPSATKPTAGWGNTSACPGTQPFFPVTYMANEQVISNNIVSIASVVQPSTTVMTADGGNSQGAECGALVSNCSRQNW